MKTDPVTEPPATVLPPDCPQTGCVRKSLNAVSRMVVFIVGPWNHRNALSWLLLIAAVLIIRWGLIESYSIPTGSMEPTLHGDPRWFRGDRVGVNKLVYGPHVPFTNRRLFRLSDPQRWDIVVFNTIETSALHKRLIKRVVGLPGERIHIQDGKIWVNGASVEPPEDLRDTLYYTDRLGHNETDVRRFALELAKSGQESPLLNPANPGVIQTYEDLDRLRLELVDADLNALTEEQRAALFDELSDLTRSILSELFVMMQEIQYPLRYGILADDEYSVVPNGCYLVCGDNSPDSADGRYFGWLPNDNILGRAFCLWWPISRARDLTGFSKTWWGMALLYGIPVSAIAYEVFESIRRRRRKAAMVAVVSGETQ